MITNFNINPQDIAANERLIIQNKEGRLEITKEPLTFAENELAQTASVSTWAFPTFILIAIVLYVLIGFVSAQVQ
ncbi:MAG: hypothetical protein ACKVTZ_03060 [Bacteroidia bacterium]